MIVAYTVEEEVADQPVGKPGVAWTSAVDAHQNKAHRDSR
jgi:hypothetical protein